MLPKIVATLCHMMANVVGNKTTQPLRIHSRAMGMVSGHSLSESSVKIFDRRELVSSEFAGTKLDHVNAFTPGADSAARCEAMRRGVRVSGSELRAVVIALQSLRGRRRDAINCCSPIGAGKKFQVKIDRLRLNQHVHKEHNEVLVEVDGRKSRPGIEQEGPSLKQQQFGWFVQRAEFVWRTVPNPARINRGGLPKFRGWG